MNKEQIVNENAKLIYSLANKFYGVEKEDLIQAGFEGLLKAYNNYDANQGTKFSTYAYFDIYGSMYELANKKNIKVSKDILKIYKIIEKTRYEEAQKLGYIPSNNEISKILNIDISTIDFACNSSAQLLSFDSESDYERNLHETVFCNQTISEDDKILLYSGIEMLPSPEKEIILERYLNDETQCNVARKLKMTQVMVSRYEKKGLTKMRDYMTT